MVTNTNIPIGNKQKKSIMTKSKRGYLWVTLTLFVITISAHWVFAWSAYYQEQVEHNQPIDIGNYLNATLRDTMENWQSEFLQLIWQVAGLSFLWYVGSPQSKEGNDRQEEKLDLLIRKIDPSNAKKLLEELEKKYPKK
ncbi:MAG: hypothetical protein M3222_05915 [Thermoproteota archaeon]|jgi:hypothetical protein|nr:hypothetical protein [Thermoproteota archaeon]MDQ4023817.1 hypothetical protein [Thermoproteota archaeon]